MEQPRDRSHNITSIDTLEPTVFDENITHKLYLETLKDKIRFLMIKFESLAFNQACPDRLMGRIRESIITINDIISPILCSDDVKACFQNAPSIISRLNEIRSLERSGHIKEDQQNERQALEMQLGVLKIKILTFCHTVLDPEGTESSEGSEKGQPISKNTNDFRKLKLAA